MGGILNISYPANQSTVKGRNLLGVRREHFRLFTYLLKQPLANQINR